MSEWMDRFLGKQEHRRGQREADTMLLAVAISATPEMTTDLIKQLEEDLKQYTLATGNQIRFERTPTGAVIVRDGTFPAFSLHIDRDQRGQPVVHCKRIITQSSNSGSVPVSFDIQIIAKGQDDFWYRFQGEDQAREAMSESLLTPLLSRL
jgi:hypothetical protein